MYLILYNKVWSRDGTGSLRGRLILAHRRLLASPAQCCGLMAGSLRLVAGSWRARCGLMAGSLRAGQQRLKKKPLIRAAHAINGKITNNLSILQEFPQLLHTFSPFVQYFLPHLPRFSPILYADLHGWREFINFAEIYDLTRTIS